jgi:hypothetical protein
VGKAIIRIKYHIVGFPLSRGELARSKYENVTVE